ncbi:MAG: DUF1592 domain-containing protein [Planctomycetaceae bacterium]|nr:DUF1592 domain-containing protein [Planctomycetaceae bacterium]
MAWLLVCGLMLPGSLCASETPESLTRLVEQYCLDCHDKPSSEGGLVLTSLAFDLNDRAVRDRWILIHDRVEKSEMPPDANDMGNEDRQAMLESLGSAIAKAERADVIANGRGPMRRLNREEYEQNLRDLLQLPQLDIRDMLPADREGHRFNKTAAMLDMSRVQLTAYLDAADAALRQAMASGLEPPPATNYRAVSTQLFSATNTFGEREAMFFAKDNRAVAPKDLDALREDSSLELALFRSAHWPYYGYPQSFVAQLPGEYRVRFSARAVLQISGYELKPATQSVPMTFRARKPSGPDVSGDVRATGGIMDIQPEARIYETTVRLLPTETFEYSLLGLPVPLARNVNGGPPTYRYPPFPEGGQPGVAFQWLEVEGPISSESWPPPSHRVLFDDLGAVVASTNPTQDAPRLLRRFVGLAAREPVPDEVVQRYEQLIHARLAQGSPFVEAMLAAYKAFLCSGHFLYLKEPSDPSTGTMDHYAIASRLSHFLTNTRPDSTLSDLARRGTLRNADTLHRETDRLIESSGFDRFVQNFTDYWLNLRHVRRDDPDIRLYPEYRFDDYLIDSMERETRAFFTAMIRDNLPSSVLVDADFIYANERLAQHYNLQPVSGSQLRKVTLPEASPYGGLLTQAAILKVSANGTSTSPVVRGAWVMERLIGQPPPPPPASVPAVEPDIRGAKTIRELLALHTKSESCAACHARFDPVGLALENFDVLGGWRTRYRGIDHGESVRGIDRAGHDFAYALAESVDASGQLRDGRVFTDIQDVKAIFASDPRQLARNLLHQFTLYSTGTPVRFADREEIESMLDACEGNGYRIRDLIHSLVQSGVFLGKEGCR